MNTETSSNICGFSIRVVQQISKDCGHPVGRNIVQRLDVNHVSTTILGCAASYSRAGYGQLML